MPTSPEHTATSPTERVIASCSFCLKPNTQLERLVAGPGVYICNECVALCAEIIVTVPKSDPIISPWERADLTVEEVLGHLSVMKSAFTQVESNLIQWVRTARELGSTWARIGEALGMTRQSAWERFSGEE